MKKITALFALIATLAFAVPVDAQVFSKNQLITPAGNTGVVYATSTANGSKLTATSSPTVGYITATSTTQPSILPLASTTVFTASSGIFGAGLSSCSGSSFLQWTSGTFGCASPVASAVWSTTSTDYYQSQFRDWNVVSGYLTPTTTRGILISASLAASSTIPNLSSTNGTTTNATSTNLSVANITATGSTTLQNFTALQATTSSATTTSFFSGTGGISTTGSTTLQNFTAKQSTSTQATSTSSFSTTASSTNLFTSLLGIATTSTSQAPLSLQANANQTMALFVGSLNNWNQINIQNRTSGNNASTQYTATADIGNDSIYYAEFGINNSGYNQASFNAQNQLDTFLSSSDGGLVISTASSTNASADIRLATGGTASSSIRMVVTAAGKIGISTTTPFAGVSVGSGNGSSTKAILVAEHQMATSSAITINWLNGNQQLVRLGNAALTLSFSNFTDGQTLKVLSCNPPTGTAGTITWGTQVIWAGGTAPTQTTSANHCDVWSFIATNGTSTLKVFGAQTANF